MGNNLHQVLRNLCLNTDWNYAILWKLKHRARMILTWEDAYYDNPDDFDSSENKQKTLKQIGRGHFSRDPLELAVAKMSYHVYSLGEGIVGQVAVTGKHRWICADNQVTSSSSCFEFADGWQSQFSAGIRTIVVIAVVPLGVVQLGSLNKVIEDMGVITYIRNLLLSTQDYSIGHVPHQIQSSVKNSSSQLDESAKNLFSAIMPPSTNNTETTTKSETLDIIMPFECSGKNYTPHAVNERMADVAKHEGPEFYIDETSILLQPRSNMMNVEHQEYVEMRPLNGRNHEGGNNGCNHTRLESEKTASSLHNPVIDNSCFIDLTRTSEKVTVDPGCFPSDFLDAIVCENDKVQCVDVNQKRVLSVTGHSNPNSQKHTDQSKFQNEPCVKDTSYTILKFPAGCELYEALGPGFLKGSKHFDWAAEVNQDVKTVEMPNEISCSQLTSESHPVNLLEAIVANICHGDNDVNSELSFCTSMQSALPPVKIPEAFIHSVQTINSEGYSIDQPSIVREDKHHCLSSPRRCAVMSPKSFSSTCPPSSYSEQFERSSEPAKNGKKRARPGESCRPRPRDRQLIQDRIKELRELVPNGAKCSIDSLLERTIKHMLFLQSITKHADKLNKFPDTNSNLHYMETDALGSSSYEQGSSWAMEVGGHLKVQSILVENLKSGQMLVEMLCEECSHFLEIAEAIRSLGLTILKGATKADGEKIWICFVVEGHSNRNVHRLDILWPLVQMLQSKSTMYLQ